MYEKANQVVRRFLLVSFIFAAQNAYFERAVLVAEERSEVPFDLGSLDLNLAKERLRKVHGDFSIKALGDWQVSYDGKTENWQWTAKGWTCPKDARVKCSDWVPFGFRWWGGSQGRAWLDKWSIVERKGFEFSKAPAERAAATLIETGVTESKVEADVAIGEPDEAESLQKLSFERNRSATEIQNWQMLGGGGDGVFQISLKSGYVSKFTFKSSAETLGWSLKAGKPFPELERMIVERNNEKLTFVKTST